MKRKKHKNLGMAPIIVVNPIYVGMGPFQRIVPRAVYVKAAMRFMKQYGRRAYLELMLDELTRAMDAESE